MHLSNSDHNLEKLLACDTSFQPDVLLQIMIGLTPKHFCH